jgi:hypothetical protein
MRFGNSLTVGRATRLASVLLTAIVALPSSSTADDPRLVVPSNDTTLRVSVDLPQPFEPAADAVWRLVEMDHPETQLPAQLAPAIAGDGTVARPLGRLLAIIPPRDGAGERRRFTLQSVTPAENRAPSPFAFDDVTDKTVRLSEAGKPVLDYNHGIITDPSVPENDPRRSCGSYIHPVWGLSGEILTDAFPADHYHHQGLFWRWKDIEVEGAHYKHWENTNIHTRFVRWLHRETGPVAAVLGVENGWFTDAGEGAGKKVMVERVWVTAFRAEEDSRSLDLQLTIIPADQPVTLTGADGKSYGGLTLRFDAWPRTDVVVRAPGHTVCDEGRKDLVANGDLANTPLPWADLSTKFPGADQRNGAAIFIPRNHPDYPPSWLTRCYGPLCVGWPGVEPKTLEPGKPVRLLYRIWIHRTEVEHDRLEREYAAYADACAGVTWEST